MASVTADSKRLQNLYVARLVTQERPCFVCSKFTGVVLTSADNSNTDWFYVCRAHLGDFNFCSKLGGSPKPAQNAQVKKEQLANRPPESSAWKSWRGSGKKSDDEDDKKKKSDKKDDQKDKEKDEAEAEEDKKTPSSPTPSTDASLPPSPASTSVPASPQQPVRFVIQRDYFYLRQREYMKKIQKKEASEKLKTLQFPEVPKTLPTKQK
ncbi:hypothetical protein MBANPS3_010248 [Mucor bainieri]